MKSFPHFLITLLLTFFSLSTAEKIDGIIAVVGDSIILSSKLEAYMFLKINQEGLKPDSLEVNILRYRLLNELIEGKVLLVHAEKDSNITVSNEEIEEELNRRINFILTQNKISLNEFEEVLKKEQGISILKFKKEVRTQIRQELLKQMVQQFYISSEKVSRSEIEDFYNEYEDSLPSLGNSIRLLKISINLSPSGDIRQKAYSKIISIKELLDNGEDFAELASLHSDGPNAANGGIIGYISKGTLNELAFEEKIFSLKPGETSAPFETRLGFHIVNILERKDQEVKVRQIFVNTSPSQESIKSAISSLDSVKAHCKSEKDFTLAVQKYSTDDVSKARDGLLNWQTLTNLDPKIKNGFDTLTVGKISAPIKVNNIVSLYRIHSLKDTRKLTLTDDWNEIALIAQRIHAQKKLRDLVNKWQKETFIDIRL
jgi:peptidyl-prolyl cis-trans isomerase SurA